MSFYLKVKIKTLDDEASRNSAVAAVLADDKADDEVRASEIPLIKSLDAASAEAVSANNAKRNVEWRSGDSETLIEKADSDALDEAITRHDFLG